MSRMPAHILYSSRYVFRTFIFVAAVAIFSLFSPVAHADPHAVFYTDRGQEQVFFNVLAALNQADYVEPGTGEYSRQGLAQNRAGAPGSFIPEQNQVIDATKTQLPGVVSRNITLEGADLWTSYLVNQFALEVATRRSVSELSRIFCERGLGRIGCSPIPGRAQQQDKAFVTQPTLREGEQDVAISAALSSGTQDEKRLRNEIRNGDNISLGASTEDGLTKGLPIYRTQRPDDAALTALRASNEDVNPALNLINSLASSLDTFSSSIDPNMFTDITFNGDEPPKVADNITTGEYVNKLERLVALPSEMLEIAQNAQETAQTFQYYEDNPTAVADYVLESDVQGALGDGAALLGRITTPVSAKIAAVNELAALAANAATSQTYTNPRTIAQSGNRSLVDPNKAPLVAGATTNATGQVAGTATTFDTKLADIYEKIYDGPQPDVLSPSIYDESVLLEPGTFDALSAFTDDTYRKGDQDNPLTSLSAFSIDMNSFLASQDVKDILCSLFPATETCLAQS